MMKRFIFVIIVICLLSVIFFQVVPTSSFGGFIIEKGYEYFIQIIDGHEYIVVTNGKNYGGGIGIVHKVNCKFCEKKQEKEKVIRR